MNDTKSQEVKKLSLPDKEDERAAALRENLKKRKAWQAAQKSESKDAKA